MFLWSIRFRSFMAIIIATLAIINTGCVTHAPCPLQYHGVLFKQQEVFIGGEEGYHTYRIPALIVTQRGTVLAFCEGRCDSHHDSGNIDIVLKRSADNGDTWSSMRLVADDGPNTIGNPCPVVDRETGKIWLLLTHNPGSIGEREISAGSDAGTRTVWVSHSTDDGVTWTDLVDVTATTKADDWTWYATGPGCGVQLACGRLIIPCDHNVAGATRNFRSHVIYSDDHGRTWQLGGAIGHDVNECQLVESVDGSLLMNMRNYDHDPCRKNRRAVATSIDRGLTWSNVWHDQSLIEPVCQAAFLRFSAQPTDTNNRLIFSNPASEKRINMSVRLSYDEARTWPVAKVLHAGPLAYSSLAVLPDGTIGCFYECGEAHPYEKIVLARFSLEWLTDGKDRL